MRIGLHRQAIYYLICKRDQEFAALNRNWEGYDYNIPGQWQGRHTELLAIGDKKSGGSAVLLGKYPDLIDQAREVIRVPIRIFHYVRNPFDNITTIANRGEIKLDDAIEVYFYNVRAITNLKKKLADDEILEIWHEDTIADPRQALRSSLAFLSLPDCAGYVEACASIVFSRPRRTRHDGAWTPRHIEEVRSRCADIAFLQRYDFDEASDADRRRA
jgi:hypothetical protein